MLELRTRCLPTMVPTYAGVVVVQTQYRLSAILPNPVPTPLLEVREAGEQALAHPQKER